MFKVAFHSIFAHPLPENHRFPMLKYELLPAQLLHEGTVQETQLFSPEEVDEKHLLLVHQRAYWKKLKQLSLSPLEQRRIGFPLSKLLVERERRIVQGTIDGALHALEDGVAFNIAGGTHHAGSDWGEGFCLLNDQAIAAAYLVNSKKLARILIVDLDVHQGNGTAEIFMNHSQVFTFSMHGEKNFPFRKEKSDLDISLADSTEDATFLTLLQEALEKIFQQFSPEFVFYQAGVDVLASDQLGRLSLSKEACRKRDEMVLRWCREHHLPVQVSMGGGYSEDIKIIVDAHCNTFRVARDLYI